MLLEAGWGLLFMIVAMAGYKRSLWLVVTGLLMHGVFDLIHAMMIANPGVPAFWPTLAVLGDSRLLCDYRNRNRAHLASWEPARDEAYYSLPAARADLARNQALAEAGQALHLAAPRNTRSAALLQRLGFERERYARAYLLIDGKWKDMVLNSLIA